MEIIVYYVFILFYQVAQGIERLLKVMVELVVYSNKNEDKDKDKTEKLLYSHNHVALADYLDKEGDYYKDKIKNVITNHLNKNGIQVYLNSFYNTMAILVTDNYAIISLYREALGKGKVPHFVFKNNGNNCEYKRILDDVRELCKRLEKIKWCNKR